MRITIEAAGMAEQLHEFQQALREGGVSLHLTDAGRVAADFTGNPAARRFGTRNAGGVELQLRLHRTDGA